MVFGCTRWWGGFGGRVSIRTWWCPWYLRDQYKPKFMWGLGVKVKVWSGWPYSLSLLQLRQGILMCLSAISGAGGDSSYCSFARSWVCSSCVAALSLILCSHSLTRRRFSSSAWLNSSCSAGVVLLLYFAGVWCVSLVFGVERLLVTGMVSSEAPEMKAGRWRGCGRRRRRR